MSTASRALVGVLIGLGLSAPAPANASTCRGAPGTSAIEQYCEAVPTAEGGRQSADDGGADRGATAPRATNEALAEAGEDGAGVARLLGADKAGEATTSESASGPTGASGKAANRAPSKPDDAKPSGVTPVHEASGSVLAASKNAVQAGPIAGSEVLWAILGLSLLATVGVVIVRRRAT